jgi:hypothetical protein
MLNTHFLRELAGWYGVVAILIAYGLNMLGWMSAHDFAYLALNITGSLGVLIDAFQQKNWQPVVLNAIWMIIGFIGLGNALLTI